MAWWVWLIAALVIGVVELATVTFVLLWIALAAFITALLTVWITSAWAQILVFAGVSVVLLVATRPLVRRWRQARSYPQRPETVIGRSGVVVSQAPPGGFATVRIGGELWSARAEQPLREGQQVVVVEMQSTVVTVEPIEGEEN